MIKIRHIVLFLCLGMIGCYTPSEVQRLVATDNDKQIQSISYFKDKRTGLCFAGTGLGMMAAVLTNVPCTPEVEKLVFSF